jgi:alkylation response protein AidB-like acyl-CoA dehydrogenase
VVSTGDSRDSPNVGDDLSLQPGSSVHSPALSIPAPTQTPDGVWPHEAWQSYRDHGVLGWTIPAEFGGVGLSSIDVLSGCIALARRDLVPAFVLTQFQSAITRLCNSARSEPRAKWLPAMAAGTAFGTVGISHLTTSRQHTAKPAVLAEPQADGYRVSGEIPWVTGGDHADVLVSGAALSDGRQILFALPMERKGVEVASAWPLVALTGSRTGPIALKDVLIRHNEILGGPAPQILQTGAVGGTGSLMTSAIALGHANGCVDRIAKEAEARSALSEIVEAFQADVDQLRADLLQTALGQVGVEHTAESLRARATALALSSSQAYLTASKGAGFVTGHDAERLAREALFFLVWSCPQAVSSRLMREFSGCENSL